MNDKNLAPLDLIQILDRVYPVGTPYFNKLDSRNPNLILGFGTWVAETGFLAGKAASGTFAALGSTGGAETVTLTTSQIPAHSHLIPSRYTAGSGGESPFYTSGPPQGNMITSVNSGGGGSHPNLPPYTVYAWWVRTA